MKSLLSLLAIFSIVGNIAINLKQTLPNTVFKHSLESNQLKNENSNSVDLSSVIKNTNLFTIKTYGTKVPTVAQIIANAQKLNLDPNINWKQITVDSNSITSTNATLIPTDSSASAMYSGSVKMTLTSNISTTLSSMITTPNLQPFQVNALGQTPLKDQIINAVKKENQNPDINWSKIVVDKNSIAATGAELISTDQSIYSGVVNITFKMFDLNHISYSYNDWYSGFTSLGIWSCEPLTLTKWTDYASNWNEFAQSFGHFTFDSSSYCKISTSWGAVESVSLDGATTALQTSKTVISSKVIDTKRAGWGTHIDLSFEMWHDSNNVYCQWFVGTINSAGSNCYFNTNFNGVIFWNDKN